MEPRERRPRISTRVGCWGVDRPDQAPFRRNLTSVRDEVSIRAPAWSYSDRRLHIGIQAKQIRRVAPLVTTAFAELNTGLSPDGRWIAYQSNASGQFEIYVQSFPNVEDGRWQISTDGGNRPAWGPDRDELFYLTADALMAVPVRTSPSFEPGRSAPAVSRSGIRLDVR